MLVNLRKNREHHKQNSEPQPQPLTHLRASTPTDLKTYRASRPQQDQCSICPSIDKVKLTEELEEQSQGSENMYEVPVEELIAQSKLKNKALEKASYIIKLLEEENEELLSQVGYLETLLKDRDRQIQALEEEIKQMKPSESQALIRQLMNERQHNTKQGSQGIINMTNEFYTFAQHRDRSFSRKSQSKIVNLDHPSFKDMNTDINISKKLTPYASKNHIDDNNTSITNLLANLSIMIVQEGIGNGRVVMEEINELIVAEEQEQEQIMLDLQALEQEIDMECELPHSPETSKVSRRLFTLEKSTSSDSSSVSQLLEKYQRCIQGYKQYAAYLRAHLCESINFLAQQSLLPTRLELNWLPNFLKLTARDLSKSLKKRTRQLQQQNSELKRIMEQLIHNIELTQYPSSLHKSY